MLIGVINKTQIGTIKWKKIIFEIRRLKLILLGVN